MPRRIFAAGSVTNTTGAPLRLEFYPTSTSLRREVDLWTIDGSNNLMERISNGVIVTDAVGAYSAFAGPDDLDTLYVLPSNTTTRTTLTGSGSNVPGAAASTWATPAASTTLTGTLAAWVVTAVDCTAGAGARTLPAANSVPSGTAVSAKKADTSSNNLVVSRAGSDKIYGTGSGSTSRTLSLAGEAVEFVSNGVDRWTVRSSDTPSGALATTYVPALVASGTGIDPTGVADSTTALQALVNTAISGNRPLYIPDGVYRITSALTISGACTIRGAGVRENWGSAITGGANALNFPNTTAPFTGTVIRQDGANVDGITITAAGKGVNLEDFAILFGTPYASTGHGINATPPADSGHYDSGPMSFTWSRLRVFGHDGNHYGFHLINPIMGTLNDLRCYGGGGIRILQDSSRGNYGNLLLDHFYACVFLTGTANGITLDRVLGALNLITMVRPQVWIQSPSPALAGTTPPTNAQYLIKSDQSSSTKNITIISPDFETNVSASSVPPLFGSNFYGLGQGGAIGVSVPSGNPVSGTAYQNKSPYSIIYHNSWAMNPTGGADATVTVELADNAGMSGATTVHSVSVPAGGITGSVVTLPVVIAAGYYVRLTWANAARQWSTSQGLS